jgi:integrase
VESTHTKNYKLACRIADRRKDEITGKRAGVGPVEPITATLSDLTTQFDDWYQTEYPRSYPRIATVLPSFQAIFAPANPLIVEVTPFDLQRWRKARLADHARSSVQRDYVIVRSMFREAETWYPGFVNPTASVKGWTIDDTEVLMPTEDEVQRALADLPPRFAMLCEITLETLARLSECLTLTRRDIGLSRGPKGDTICWLWRRLKGGKRKRVQISEALYTALVGLLVRPGQQNLFDCRNKKGQWVRMAQEATSSYFTRLFRALEMPHVTHHKFRHLGITLMHDRGVSAKAIQELAGWTTGRMLDRYGRVRDAELQRGTIGNAAAVQAIKDGQRTQVALLPPAEDEAVAK